MLNPETASPFCIRDYVICNDKQERLHEMIGNHQSRRMIQFDGPMETSRLTIHLKAPGEPIPASLMEVRCY